jgi:hypothetical protein
VVDAVDGNKGAVEDRVGQQSDPVHGRLQVVGGRGEQGDRLTDVAPGRGNADLEAGGQAGERVAVAQVSQRKQRLAAGTEATPVRSTLVAMGADQVGKVVQRSGRRGIAAG